MIDNIDNIK